MTRFPGPFQIQGPVVHESRATARLSDDAVAVSVITVSAGAVIPTANRMVQVLPGLIMRIFLAHGWTAGAYSGAVHEPSPAFQSTSLLEKMAPSGT